MDDADVFSETIKKTIRFDKNTKTLVDDNPNHDCTDMKTGEEMMDLLREVANSITPMVVWEHDWPDKHPDGWLPVLDIQMKVDPDDRDNLVKHKFYQKPVSNKNLVSADSCMPRNVKFSTLVEEGYRRLRNSSPSVLQAEQGSILLDAESWPL